MTPTPTLAHRIREAALRVPRPQARQLYDIAADADRLESLIDEIVGDACVAERLVAQAERHGATNLFAVKPHG